MRTRILIGLHGATEDKVMLYSDGTIANKQYALLRNAWKAWLNHPECTPLRLYEMHDESGQLLLDLDTVANIDIYSWNEASKQRALAHKLWDGRIEKECARILAEEESLDKPVGFR
jgi:hypothetical protein